MSSEATTVRSTSLRRIPSLDGLRALSIIMVMGLHTIQRYSIDHPVSLWWSVVLNGSLGVYIFFVISGYLITRLLLHEQESRGSISLSGFYLKRAFRILPPLYVYVAVLAALAAVGRLELSRIDVVSALFFFHNYALASTSWAIEQFWSLSVEEQFYLLWPLLLIACLRTGGSAGRLRAAWIAGAVILVSPVLRVVSFRVHQPLLHDSAGFHMHADALMFGCVTALLEGRALFERVYGAITRVAWLPVLGLAVGSYLEIRFQNYWNFPIGETYTGLLIAAVLLWTVRNAGSLPGLLLNASAVTHLGVLSYSVYLWQTLFLHHENARIFASVPALGRFPLNWICVLLVAELSYRLVERPSLTARNHALRALAVYAAPARAARTAHAGADPLHRPEKA